MKSPLIGIDFVKAAVNQMHFNVHHVIAGEVSALHRVVNALFGWLDEFARNCAALDLVLEHKTFAGRGLDLQLDVRVLAAAAGLLLEYLLAGSGLRNGVSISILRFAGVSFG